MSEDIVGPAPPDLRASDADREQLATELRAHAVAGRIDTDELEARVQSAYSARTLGELDALRRDLPATPEQVALAMRERRSQLVRRTVQQTGGSLGLFVLCTAIWAGSGANGFFWPLFVVIGVVGLLLRNAWDLYGPAADFDAVETRLDREREKRRAKLEKRQAGRELKERHRRRILDDVEENLGSSRQARRRERGRRR